MEQNEKTQQQKCAKRRYIFQLFSTSAVVIRIVMHC